MSLPETISPADPGHIGDHEEIATLLQQASVASLDLALIAQGLFSGRPAAGHQGLFYFATDRGTLYYDNGAAWKAVNADSSLFVQEDVQSNSSTVALAFTANAVVYSFTTGLPSGWASMDVDVRAYVANDYNTGTGFRRAVAQAVIDGSGPSHFSSVDWEDIAGSVITRGRPHVLANSKTNRTTAVTIDIQNWLNSAAGPSYVNATSCDLYVTKYRRS